MALTPQEQTLFQQLQAKASAQADASAQTPTSQQPSLQAQPGDKMHPEEAMQQIMARATGPQLQQGKEGLMARKPVDQPLLRLFGVKKNVPVGEDYFPTIQQAGLADYIPQGAPRTPQGMPFIDEKTADQIRQTVGKKAGAGDAPNPALGNLALTKLEKTYGKDSPIYQNASEAVKSMGGISLNKLQDFVGTTMREETPNFIRGANGLYQMYDRAAGEFKTVPGQTTGVLSVLGDPATAKMFDTKLQDFNSDPVVKGLKTSLDQLTNASAILESNNPASIGILFSNIAKSIGKEAGVLTEGDIARSVGDPGVAAQLYRWYNKKADIFNGKGQFSEKDLKDFRGLFQDLGTSLDKRYESALTRHVSSAVKTIPGMTEDFVKGAFDTANRFMPADQRRLKGQATNHDKVIEGQTKSGVKFKVIK